MSSRSDREKRDALHARKDAAGWCVDDDDAVAEMVFSGWTRESAIENVLATLEADIAADAKTSPPACDAPETCFDPGCGCKFRNGGG